MSDLLGLLFGFRKEISHSEAHEIQGLERDLAKALREKGELETENARLREALTDAAMSLDAISTSRCPETQELFVSTIGAYAESMARVASETLQESDDE